MSRRYSYRSGDDLICSLVLTFNAQGDVRLSRGAPSLSPGERSMSLDVRLPLAIFRTPQLSASLTVKAPEQGAPLIDVTAAEAALASVVGCDVMVRVVEGNERG